MALKEQEWPNIRCSGLTSTLMITGTDVDSGGTPLSAAVTLNVILPLSSGLRASRSSALLFFKTPLVGSMVKLKL